MTDLKSLRAELSSVVIFKNVLNAEPMAKLIKLIDEVLCKGENRVEAYADFVGALYKESANLTEVVLKLTLEDENLYIKRSVNGGEIPQEMYECVKNELEILRRLSRVTSDELVAGTGFSGFLPKWQVSEVNFKDVYTERLNNISVYGFGMFARNRAFVIKNNELYAVEHPDSTSLSQLSGYEAERGEVIANTLAFLSGKPANNVLLYGDCGTGKSSTVKAILNEYADLGLRLIELKKKQLHLLPEVVEMIAENPLRFIIFIDDLSFDGDDDDYSDLKAVLEGSVSSTAPNMIIYATSNRRHLVKESFSDRNGDDIHFSDTREEMLSLSERFGLTVTFLKPDKKLFLKVVEDLARQYDIKLPIDEVLRQAEVFALYRGGRSPRTAKQFIEQLKGAE